MPQAVVRATRRGSHQPRLTTSWLPTRACHLGPSVAVLVDRSASRALSITLWLSSTGGRGSPRSLPRLPVERASFDHLYDPRRRVVGCLTFWLDDLGLDDLLRLGVVTITAARRVALDRWRRIWLRLDTQLLGVAERPLEEPYDRVLRRRNDLMYLRRDQTRAVEEILGDLGADPNGTSVSSIILTSICAAWSAVMISRSAARRLTWGAAPPCWSQTTAPSSASRLHLLP
jgi:hypothetical protein